MQDQTYDCSACMGQFIKPAKDPYAQIIHPFIAEDGEIRFRILCPRCIKQITDNTSHRDNHTHP